MTPDAIAAREAMMNPDDAAMAAASLLNEKLRRAERANYVGMRIVRDPKPRFAFQFRKDAAATLTRHSRDPRFTSREGGVPAEELQPVLDEWWKRFEPNRLIGAGSVQEFDGMVQFYLTVDEAEFREIAARNRWILPPMIDLKFSQPRNPKSVDPDLRRYVRIFARQDRQPAVVNTAALSGRIILRDGCFRLVRSNEKVQPLVIFGRDIELSRDGQNYMALRTGAEGLLPRIGETMVWSGPRGYAEADPAIAALRAACGQGEIIAVGEPMSAGGG